MPDDTTAPLVIDDDLLAAGFITVPRAIWLNTALTITARSLYATLLHFAWEAERPCWPGYARLMQLHGWASNTLTKYIQELQTTGYLTISRRGQGLTNLYTLHARPQAEPQKLRNKKLRAARTSKSEAPAPQNRNGEVSSEELDALWEAQLLRLGTQMTAGNFRTWLTGTRLVALRGDTATIAAPPATRPGLRRLAPLICKALRESTERPITRCEFIHY